MRLKTFSPPNLAETKVKQFVKSLKEFLEAYVGETATFSTHLESVLEVWLVEIIAILRPGRNFYQ